MKQASIPAAIVAGMTILGAFVGAGLYFGLRARGEPTTLAPTTGVEVTTSDVARAVGATSSDPTRVAATVASPPGPAPQVDRAPPMPRVDRTAVDSQVARELDDVRPQLVANCWNPSVAKAAAPDHTKLIVDVTFDANGHEISRGINEDRATARPEVTYCVQMSLGPLHIDPQGRRMHLSVPLSLPQ